MNVALFSSNVKSHWVLLIRSLPVMRPETPWTVHCGNLWCPDQIPLLWIRGLISDEVDQHAIIELPPAHTLTSFRVQQTVRSASSEPNHNIKKPTHFRTFYISCTMASVPIALTGTTGVLGGAIARLLAPNHSLRMLVRDASRAQTFDGSTAVGGCGFENEAACTSAMKGCEVLLMVSAAEHPDRLKQHYSFIAAAKAAGIRHLVYTSFYNAAPDAEFRLARDHWLTEERIRSSGIPKWTMLRNNFYMDALVGFVDKHGVIKGPAENGKLSPVARQDVASAAAAVLASPAKHSHKTYNLTGGERFSLAEVAHAMKQAVDSPKSFAFRNETYEEAIASRESDSGAPRWLIEAWVSTYTAIAKRQMDGCSGDIEYLTGEKPTTFKAFLGNWSTAT